MVFDVDKVRADFPILTKEINGNQLVYLDNGASAQKPKVVIDAIELAYRGEYANVHRGLHTLSNLATEKYEKTRGIIAKFLNVREQNIIFTTGSTEGINLVSYAWGMPNLKAGDQIILSVSEHHANIVPWHFLRERQGVELIWVDCDDHGQVHAQDIIAAITDKTKLIAIGHMSNVTGLYIDIEAITSAAHDRDIRVLVDGSQAAVHGPIDLSQLGVDFYAITGHKLYGPSGSGALYVSEQAFAEMQPFLGGGDMIDRVTKENVTYAKNPLRFEAGTPGIVETIGLGAALEYLMLLGMDNIAQHERELAAYANETLSALDFIEIQGQGISKGAIFSLIMKGAHAHDISTLLDSKGIAVRAGTHCAQPLMERFGLTATCRASFGLYNTKAEVDQLVDALKFAHRLLT